MTPKADGLLKAHDGMKNAALNGIAVAIKAAAASAAGQISAAEASAQIEASLSVAGTSLFGMGDIAAVLAEPMSIPVAPVAEPAPEPEAAPQADANTEEPVSSEPQQSSADPGPGLYTSRRKSDRTAV